MGTMTEIRLPVNEFALHETFRAVPSTNVEIQRVVAHSADHLVPFLWVTADDFDALHESFEDDASVDSLSRLSEFDGERLYRMSWGSKVAVVAHALAEQDATVLSAVGTDDEWSMRLFFPGRDALQRTHEFADDEGLSMTVDAIYETSDSNRDRFGLTGPQHETLVTAFEQGYYDFPHGVTTEELGSSFDVSAQAAADRLRRGHGNLVEEALVAGDLADVESE
ncbi:bacterio-opsin activator domain-containing protein [Halomarina salina]|uniref:Bacterio-opsin activator domain-containing protein n=1 Tax=Halomarina salina TaxID=1872699 RepID=A0ABD5RI50_9EURY|nr:bacterio-opsin activator domain-containing protein [Halomarina salina]